MMLSHNGVLYLTSAVAIIGIISTTYFVHTSQEQAKRIDTLLTERDRFLDERNQKSEELAAASTTITELRSDLSELRDDLEDLADDYRDEKDRNEEFEDQIRDLAGTLGDLDKLSQIDEELLQKYSKVYFLNENYYPERLDEIDEELVLDGRGDQYFHARAMDHLEDLMEAAEDDDIDLRIASAYRSFDEQSELKGQYKQVYGEGANTFSADQGYSEHQLGTTVDFTTPQVGGISVSFAETEAYQWLLDNAHEYGFILSYPEDNGFYVYEPWHWRFVSTELAEDLHESDETFYTMDQREIDKYRLEFFD